MSGSGPLRAAPTVSSPDDEAARRRSSPRSIAAVALASIGVAILAAALAADGRWLDRHFLPSFFLPRPWYVAIHAVVRWTIVLAGASLVVAARTLPARLTARAVGGAARIAIAALLALGASELVLQRVHLRPAEWLQANDEPRRRADPRLGWTLAPARTGRSVVAGRTIEYAVDESGYRVRRADLPVDRERPTILFVGESVMFGEGLTWDETVPAQVESILDVQSANLAVHGYSTDQAYLRLEEELPRFRRPVAVVALFMTALFGRNLDDDRPHLGPDLVWMPAVEHARIVTLAGLLVPYRRDETVEDGIRATRDVLRAMVALARSRGATPLVVVPQFGPEQPIERTLRRRVLDGTDVPYELVAIDGAWRLSWDRHPNARAARAIAVAVAGRLRRR
jgi:hypothetical protein